MVLGAGLMAGGLAVARRIDRTDPSGRPGRALELPPRIDVHHHAMPGAVRSWLAAADWPPGFERPLFAPWSVRDTLTALDQHGTELAVLSTPIPAALTPTIAHTSELARLVNDSLHGIATDHPTRFGWLARVPLLDVDDALAEINRVYDQLHPDGVLLTTHDGDHLLGDPTFDPVMAALHARNAVVLVHPDAPPDLYPGSLPPFVVDEPTDITRAAVSLTMSGTLDRYPAIRWILAYSGGAFPYLAGRLTAGRGLGYGADPATVRAAVQRFSYDTAGPMSPYATPTLLTATATATGAGAGAGAGAILYGSDSHAVPPATVADGLAQLCADPALDAVTGAAIARSNALRLFPTLHRRLTQTRP
ncbi:amidohydrolase family protein [Parafrankia sp. BMG5.11]|uniref:amidohydrolase family protein n=1 Tax=Parafrankia sp. BMG5.11 TaxID=222540 RepID=UPI001FB2B0BA|nr:amidohydrolase family protein [Parafrankia sp. BMG5.11]